jgi:5-methylthioribose kinase
MHEVWEDCVGFMGAVIIRRIVGIAHVADLETIADADVRWVLQVYMGFSFC